MSICPIRSAQRARMYAPGARASRARPLRVRASVALILTIVQLAGCYRYVPVSAAVMPVGAEVSLAVNDRGRVALSDAVGPGVRRMEGRVLENTDSSLVLAVMSVQHIDLGVPAK